MIATLLWVNAGVLLFGHDAAAAGALVTGLAQIVAGVIAGFLIGLVASLFGAAGGELLIPTLVLLFGTDIKLARNLSQAVSLPTMIVGFTRYSRDQSFAALGRNRTFLLTTVAGSIVCTFIGGQLLGVVPSTVLLPVLVAILLISAVKFWRHALGQGLVTTDNPDGNFSHLCVSRGLSLYAAEELFSGPLRGIAQPSILNRMKLNHLNSTGSPIRIGLYAAGTPTPICVAIGV